MANPNIVNVTSIYGKTIGHNITTSATAVVENASGSGEIYKINSLIVANIDGTNAADITAYVYKNGATAYYLAYTISVPADATLVVLSKDTSVYLEENDAIYLQASVNGDLSAVCSYEIIS
jgi:hypothetical protein